MLVPVLTSASLQSFQVVSLLARHRRWLKRRIFAENNVEGRAPSDILAAEGNESQNHGRHVTQHCIDNTVGGGFDSDAETIRFSLDRLQNKQRQANASGRQRSRASTIILPSSA